MVLQEVASADNKIRVAVPYDTSAEDFSEKLLPIDNGRLEYLSTNGMDWLNFLTNSVTLSSRRMNLSIK